MSEKVNGRFRFELAHRQVDGDAGLAIHVYGPTANSSEEEVLRFDCFEKQPHYHLAWSYRNDPFIPIESTEPFAWALQKLKSDMPDLFAEADALPMNNAELSRLESILLSIEADSQGLIGRPGS